MLMDDDECGAIERMIGKGNQSTLRKLSIVTEKFLKLIQEFVL
jgi:hypothetical protein